MPAQTYTVEKQCSGSEDGWLWYVIAPDGSRHDNGGWLHREDAEAEAADLNKLAALSDDERQAVETLRGYCPAPDDYGVAVVGKFSDGSRGAPEARLTRGSAQGDKSPAEVRDELRRDYRHEHGAKLVDIMGDVFELDGFETDQREPEDHEYGCPRSEVWDGTSEPCRCFSLDSEKAAQIAARIAHDAIPKLLAYIERDLLTNEEAAQQARDILNDLAASEVLMFLGLLPSDVVDLLTLDEITFAGVPIEELELGVRAYNILKRLGVNTGADLVKLTVEDLNEWTRRTDIAVGLPAFRQMVEAVERLRLS